MGYTISQILNRCAKTPVQPKENVLARERFEALLLSTEREGIENVLDYLSSTDFFAAPASCRKHNSQEYGLLMHSLNVYDEAMALREKQIQLNPALEHFLPKESVTIASLLHDVCKADIYKELPSRSLFVFSTEQKVCSYKCDYGKFPIGHGEKSVIVLLMAGLKMTRDEMLAIRWHMAPWDLAFQSQDSINNANTAMNESPLVMLVSTADSLATRLVEGKIG